ncbi:MAG: hypothetical protein M5U26_16130 [Planctomycetota bacterium]|nr:hypothetical protein [Planctomycetota bacterium]
MKQPSGLAKSPSCYLTTLLAALYAGTLYAQDFDPAAREGFSSEALRQYMGLLFSAAPWGYLLLALSFFILILVIFCTRNAGEAFRSGNKQAFGSLPGVLDADGLLDLRDQLETGAGGSGPLRRSLRVGLVKSRGGLLISKSAVLAAWDAERRAYRIWPQVMLALGMVSLALSVLAATNQLPILFRGWEGSTGLIRLSDGSLEALHRAHALLTWGLTNTFIGLLLYFVFDRVTQAFLNASTAALLRYLGTSTEEGAAAFAQAQGAQAVGASDA